jgi:hypothetical protein
MHLYIATQIRVNHVGGGGGYERSTQDIWRAQLGLLPPSRTSPQVTEFLIRLDIFIKLFCDWERRYSVFLFVAIQY